jgi:hypothetical protein
MIGLRAAMAPLRTEVAFGVPDHPGVLPEHVLQHVAGVIVAVRAWKLNYRSPQAGSTSSNSTA